MHRFSNQPESLFVGAIASVPAIASAASASPVLPRELPVQRVNRLARELAYAMDDWMADISHPDDPRALWKAHVWPASTGLGICFENHDRGLS